MKTIARLALVAAALAIIPACGGSDDETDGGTANFTMSSGNYVATNLAKADSDTCDLFPTLQAALQNNVPLVASVNGSNLQMDWESLEGNVPAGTITGDTFSATFARQSYNVPDDNNNPSGCIVNASRSFNGTLTANDQFDGRFKVTFDVISGGDICHTLGLIPSTTSCTSTLSFTAKKQ